ncbi:MAG: hypothetical protein KDE50_15370, partial [Caldilineaceae bacterium]|nr:hypothetical protein [Caldilineaceae bacterium]
VAPTFDNDGYMDNKFTLTLRADEVIADVNFGYRSTGAMTSAELAAAEVNASTIELAFLPLIMQ